MDKLMNLEDIEGARRYFTVLDSPLMIHLCDTARAAHELKEKYEDLLKEKSWSYENAAQAAAIALENERLKEQLLTAREEERERCLNACLAVENYYVRGFGTQAGECAKAIRSLKDE